MDSHDLLGRPAAQAPLRMPLPAAPGRLLTQDEESDGTKTCWGVAMSGSSRNCTPGFNITKANKFVGKFCPR